ncbi:MAG: ribosome small subunit-dependent GTPase A, partial [Paraclostridium sp.]
DEENKKGVLEEIEKRDTELVRPPISNVNKAIIVFAIKNPNPNLSLLDRFIVLAERECLDIVIVLTKADLATDEELENLKRIYEMSGYKVIPVSNNENLNIDKVKEELKGNIVVFAGPSGVGKSTLLNHIDSKFQLQTGEVSDKIKRGKHTTRHAELLKLECGGMVADTPGFSSLTLDDIEETELKEYFIEFDEFSDECKFGGRCMHENEPSCGIKEAVKDNKISKERYESYLQLLNEKRQGKRRY